MTRKFALLIAVAIGVATPAWSFVVNSQLQYGQLTGPEVTYSNIVESSSTDNFSVSPSGTELGHYGVPALNADSLTFSSPSFGAVVAPGPGLDITDGFLSFSFESTSLIRGFRLSEFGAVSLTSPLGGSNLTLVNIEAPVFVTIREVAMEDGSLLALPSAFTIASTANISPTQASPPGWDSLDDSTGYWEADLDLDLLPELQAHVNSLPGSTGVGVVGILGGEYKMNNLLTALAEDGVSSAFIDKKGVVIEPWFGDGTPPPNVMPEPSSAVLIGVMSLAGLGIFRKRER